MVLYEIGAFLFYLLSTNYVRCYKNLFALVLACFYQVMNILQQLPILISCIHFNLGLYSSNRDKCLSQSVNVNHYHWETNAHHKLFFMRQHSGPLLRDIDYVRSQVLGLLADETCYCFFAHLPAWL